ncbi:MAG: hypothetical protein ACI4DS_07645, partial [Eubacterium sp.]
MEKGNSLAQTIKAAAIVLLICGMLIAILVGAAYEAMYGLSVAVGFLIIVLILFGFGELIQQVYELNIRAQRIEARLIGKKVERSYITGGSYRAPGETEES